MTNRIPVTDEITTKRATTTPIAPMTDEELAALYEEAARWRFVTIYPDKSKALLERLRIAENLCKEALHSAGEVGSDDYHEALEAWKAIK